MAALADPEATTVVFMGKRTFASLAQKLVGFGLPSDTPALLAEAVSTPEQTLTRTTITALVETLKGEMASTPALILYGPLASDDDA